MVQLSETSNITLKKIEIAYQGKPCNFFEVPAIGDGNCAFNAFSLGLIDHLLIAKNKNQAPYFTDVALHALIEAIIKPNSMETLRERHKLYLVKPSMPSSLKGNAYTDLEKPLEKFIQLMDGFIERGQISVKDFVEYIQKNATSRHEIAALHVALSPGLRSIGAQKHIDTLNSNDKHILLDAELLAFDGELAGDELLAPLGKFFNINLEIMDTDSNRAISPDLTISPDAPTIYLHYVPGHFNYLIPENQNQGIQAVLSANNAILDNKQEDHSAEIDDLLLWQNERILDTQHTLRSNELAEIANVAREIGNRFIDLDKKGTTPNNIIQAKKIQAAKTSQQLVTSIKEKLGVTDDKLTALITSLNMNTLQKELLTQPLPSGNENDSDEVYARSLQNEEILSFFSQHHSFFSKTAHRDKAKPVAESVAAKKIK